MKMIPINEVQNNLSILQSMKDEEIKKFNFLIKNAQNMGINYVNIENIFGIDQYGKILEVKHNKEKDEYMISEPSGANYREEQITTSDRINDSYTETEQYNNLQSDFEDKPKIETVEEYDQLSEEIKEQVKVYYEYPELLEMIPTEEKNQWKKYIEIYELKLQKENEMYNQQNKPKQLVYKKQDKKSGFADVLLLSLITGFLGGVLTTLTTILLTK